MSLPRAATRFVCLCLFGLALSLLAESAGAYRLPETCAQSTIDSVDCIEREIKVSNQKIKNRMTTLKSRLARRDTIAVRFAKSSHEAWLSFREANCSSETHDAWGGTLMETLYLSCVQTMNEKRIILLDSWLRQLNAKLTSCPNPGPHAQNFEPVREAEMRLRARLSRLARTTQTGERINIESLMLNALDKAQQQWSHSRSLTCFAQFLTFCKQFEPSPEDREFWMKRCEENSVGGRLREIDSRLKLHDANNMADEE